MKRISPIETKPMVIGFDQYVETVIKAGCYADVCIHPQRLFRIDFLYFETEGLILRDVKVGNLLQNIQGVPTSYYKERETAESMKGRPVSFDTAEVGMIIRFYFHNPTAANLPVRGCVEGQSTF